MDDAETRYEMLRVGDLVEYIAITRRLVGVVISIDELTGRAQVYWQTYNSSKMVEFKYLRILGN